MVVIQSQAIHAAGRTEIGTGKARIDKSIPRHSFKDSTVMAARGGVFPAKNKTMVGGKNGSKPRSKLLIQVGFHGMLFFGLMLLLWPKSKRLSHYSGEKHEIFINNDVVVILGPIIFCIIL